MAFVLFFRMKAMASEVNPNLFTYPDGSPIVFAMRPCNEKDRFHGKVKVRVHFDASFYFFSIAFVYFSIDYVPESMLCGRDYRHESTPELTMFSHTVCCRQLAER